MTTTIRVSDIKKSQGSGGHPPGGMPREGTAIRNKYDALRRGDVVSLGRCGTTLRDMYGMDIEAVRVSGKRGPGGSRLVGEWDGPYYIPVERIVTSLLETA